MATAQALSRPLKAYELPLPGIYNPEEVSGFYDPDKYVITNKATGAEENVLIALPPPNYRIVMNAARAWAVQHKIAPRRKDKHPVGMTIIDMQRTFCQKTGELTLEPASIADSRRICEFTYRNTRILSNLMPTLDTHFLCQIFHPAFILKEDGSFVDDITVVLPEDLKSGKYRVNPEMAYCILGDMKYLPWLQAYVLAYTEQLAALGKPPLIIWPVHGLLGSPGHALVPAIQTACQVHEIARWARTNYRIKGDKPLSEHYSPFGTEVVDIIVHGQKMTVGELSDAVIDDMLANVISIICGEASSHCVGMGIFDILRRILKQDKKLARKVYIMEDCTSPVPGFEDQAEKAFKEFAAAGMHLVKSTTPMDEWPDVPQEIFEAYK